MEFRSRLAAKPSFLWEVENKPWAPTHIQAGVNRVKSLVADTGRRPPPQLRVAEAHDELLAAWHGQRTLDGVSPRVLRVVPFFIFAAQEPGRDSPLAADPEFRAAYLRWIHDRNRSVTLALLCKTFLQAYPDRTSWFSDCRESLSQELERSRGAAVERWWSRAKAFGLLADHGPEQFCRCVLEASESPEELLSRAGLEGELAHARFLEKSQSWAVVALAQEMRTDCRLAVIDRLLAFLQASPKRLRFDGLRTDVATALLEPFRNQDPQRHEVRERVQQVLLSVLGDPRITPGSWHGVAEPDRRTMLRWLTAVAFETFMQVLNLTADERWQSRREFWEGYLPRGDHPGALVEAWPVFGPDAAKLARTKLKMEENLFGTVPTTDKRQSVLIMRIQGSSGAVTVCEWSHAGAVRLWRSDDEAAPPFYKRSYTVRELRGQTPDWFGHDQHNAWQRKMRSRISEETGARPWMGGSSKWSR